MGLLDVRLVIRLVAGAFSQLGSFSTGTILGPGCIVQEGDLRDNWSLW